MSQHRDLTRHMFVIGVLAPMLVGLAIAAFAWPAARLAPRDLPVGVVETSPSPLDRLLGAGSGDDGTFAVHHYADDGAARAAIADRDIYGAFAPTTTGALTVYVATAASPTVAQQLEALGAQWATATGGRTRTLDVVPTAAGDPRGVVLGSAVLPLVFGGEIIAVVVVLLLGVKPARRQLAALAVTSAAAAAAAYAIAQGWLGALPHQHLATWGALGLMLLAVSATTAGLYALLGIRGIGIGAATMIFLGNPFSGVASAPELLPSPANWLGTLLPPGAGGTLLRSTAYFDGHGALAPVCVLLAWTLAGAAMVVVGHRRMPSGPDEPLVVGRHAALEPVG